MVPGPSPRLRRRRWPSVAASARVILANQPAGRAGIDFLPSCFAGPGASERYVLADGLPGVAALAVARAAAAASGLSPAGVECFEGVLPDAAAAGRLADEVAAVARALDAEGLADAMADLAWSLREAFQLPTAVPVDAALCRAEAAPKGMIVPSETGDTVFGGAAGDSNPILEALLRPGIRSRTAIPLISPGLAARLCAAGTAAEFTRPVGGDRTPFFRPLAVRGRVLRCFPGGLTAALDDRGREDMGQVAVFEFGSATLRVTERRGVAGNLPSASAACKVDRSDFGIAVLKTASNWQKFAPLTAEVIRADSPGPGRSDLRALPWRRQPRPVHSLDGVTDRPAAAAAGGLTARTQFRRPEVTRCDRGHPDGCGRSRPGPGRRRRSSRGPLARPGRSRARCAWPSFAR